MPLRIMVCLVSLAFFTQAPGQLNDLDRKAQEKGAPDLRGRIEASPNVPFNGVHFAAKPPAIGWESGAVSWVAVDGGGLIYELQRGDTADPVLVLDRAGKVVRSWGKGNYKIPHSIRIDPAGNVWTVDAASSIVIKYSALGEKLMTVTAAASAKSRVMSARSASSSFLLVLCVWILFSASSFFQLIR
jgi:hypothetical protein